MSADKNIFDNLRFIVNIIYTMIGAGVLSFLFLMVYRMGIFNIAYIVFFIWLGMYLIFSRSFVYSIKERRERWGKVKHDLCLAAVRAPMTVLNIVFIALFIYGIRVPYLLWGCIFAAWSIIPVNMLIDHLEKR